MFIRLVLAAAMLLVPRTEHSPAPTQHSPQDQARLDQALGDFAAAGLELPNIDIRFADDRAGCKGHDGLFQPSFSPWRLTVCSDRDYVLQHELAHAWTEANLTEADKLLFVSRLGLPSWNDKSDDWNDRGTEVAAFTIQQNVANKKVPDSRSWRQRIADYEALTGQESPLHH